MIGEHVFLGHDATHKQDVFEPLQHLGEALILFDTEERRVDGQAHLREVSVAGLLEVQPSVVRMVDAPVEYGRILRERIDRGLAQRGHLGVKVDGEMRRRDAVVIHDLEVRAAIKRGEVLAPDRIVEI